MIYMYKVHRVRPSHSQWVCEDTDCGECDMDNDQMESKAGLEGTVRIIDIKHLGSGNRETAFLKVKRIEKKTFPRIEAFDFDAECKKANTRLLVALYDEKFEDSYPTVVGYLVYLRIRRTTLLHKICVTQECRRNGVASTLLSHMIEDVQDSASGSVHLWVDTKREAALNLYTRHGFTITETLADYYAPGRDAHKMVLSLGVNG